jgi:hypothetical protein
MNPTDRPTEPGINRTGISVSPIDGPALVEAASQAVPTSPGSDRDLAEVRKRFMEEVSAFGHMPPHTTVKGVVSAGKDLIKGQRNAVFLDKLGERLAFERTGVRLFDGLIAKLEAYGSWEGGPMLADLDTFRDDESRHFALIHETLVNLGADPTAVTPSADLVGVESMGVLQAIVDPRTTLAQALHAHLIAELVDAAAWDQLVVLADLLGHEQLARSFREAHVQEIKHRDTVAEWLEKHTALAARGELKYSA